MLAHCIGNRNYTVRQTVAVHREPDEVTDSDDDKLGLPTFERIARGLLEENAAFDDFRALLVLNGIGGFVYMRG